MGQHYGSKPLLDGLIINIDPANVKSYPGTGTTVNNLANSALNGTLSGAVYDASNGGTFHFDGVNDIINFGVGSDFFPMQTFTFDIWFSSDGTTATTGTTPALFGFTYGIGMFVNSNQLWVGLDNGTNIQSFFGPTNYSFYDSSWHHAAFKADSGNVYLYIDGDLVMSSTITSWSGTSRWPTNSVNFGRDNNNSMYFFRGKMGPIKVYNRLLSDAEVKQNFKAIRGRYGL